MIFAVVARSRPTLIFAIFPYLVGAQSLAQPPRGLRHDAASVSSLPAAANRWALVIGVDQYQDAHIGRLAGAANDARTVADVLVKFGGFPQDQVIVLATSEPAERQPTRINILRRLSNFRVGIPKDGLFLFAFSGHGIDRSGKGFLIPSDAQLSSDVDFMQETALSLDLIKNRIQGMNISQTLLFIDACRNEPGGRADSANHLTKAFVDRLRLDNRDVRAFAVIYATSIGQRAYEYAEKQQGYLLGLS